MLETPEDVATIIEQIEFTLNYCIGYASKSESLIYTCAFSQLVVIFKVSDFH